MKSINHFFWRLLAGNMLACVFGSACSTVKPLHYSVAIVNEGQGWIRVEPIILSAAAHSTVHVGEVHPGGRAGMSPFYEKPNQELFIQWRLVETGEEGQARVITDFPKAFTKKHGRALVFHIRPEGKTVAVTYEILDPQTGQTRVIGPGFE